MTADLNDLQAREARRLERTRQRIRASRAKWSIVRSNLGASILTAMLAGAKQALQANVAYCRDARDNAKLSKSERVQVEAVAGAHMNDLLGAALDAFVDMKPERQREYLYTYITAEADAFKEAQPQAAGLADEAPAGYDNPPHDIPQAASDEHAVSRLDDLALHFGGAPASTGGV